MPTVTPAPTINPTDLVTPAPTSSPTDLVTPAPTSNPTDLVTPAPTSNPTDIVTPAPTSNPTDLLTPAPTINPTDLVTSAPTSNPTDLVTPAPTNQPTAVTTPPTSLTPTSAPTTLTLSPTTQPTPDPTNEPTEQPTFSPTTSPTTFPTSSPTVFPSDDSSWCIPLQEWSQARSDETCPGEASHAFGVQICESHLNEDYTSRLEIALANELYSKCNHACLYDYETYDSSKPYGFIWKSNLDCYTPVYAYYCIEDATEAMAEAHEHAALLCDLPEEPCEERREWSQQTADYWCPDGDNGADKGYGSAVVCDDAERLYDGYYELTSVLYKESFEKSLANHMYRSCISTCVYDILWETAVGYIWKESRGCWKKVTAWTCYVQQEQELFEVQDRLENHLCYEATPAPISYECTERVKSWNDEISDMSCTLDDMGLTTKNASAVVCEGYEEHQYRLDHSLANRMFLSCSAWCVYDIYTRAYEGFIWKNSLGCWNLVTKGFCLEHRSNDREEMTDWVDNQLCPSDTLEPTYQPTCTPQEEYSDTLMDEYCSVEDTGSTYKHYDGVIDDSGIAVNRSAIACTELNGDDSGAQDTADLLKSLANKMYEGCSAWCVFDFYTEAMEAWKWSNSNKCWNRKTSGGCFYDYTAKEDLQIWYDMQEKITITCTLSPTLSPTACYPNYEWSQERADEICQVEGYGTTDRSYSGAVVCSDSTSSTKQAQLEVTLANEFYTSCASHCLYDWDTLINDIDGFGAFIWKSTCWKWVTAWTCYTSSADEHAEVREKAMKTCAYEATL